MKAVAVVTLCLSAALAATLAATLAARGETPATDAPAPPAAAVVASRASASFEGIWLFDAKRSDDPKKVMEQARGGAGGRGGGPPGGGRGGRPPGGGPPGGGRGMGPGGPPPGMAEGGEDEGAGGASSRSGGDPRRAMDRVVNPARKMVVYVDGERFQVEEDEGSPRVYTIADSLKALGVNALETEATVKVRGRRHEAKQPLGRRGALLETFELSEDGRSLTIRARRQGGPEGMSNPTITRVYTRYDGE